MLSPWDVYWVMQADSFCCLLLTLSVVLCVVAIGSGVIWLMCFSAPLSASEKTIGRALLNSLWVSVPASILLLIATAAAPSTRTLAAMYVLPAIVNNEQIQDEAADLYELAKEGLRNVV